MKQTTIAVQKRDNKQRAKLMDSLNIIDEQAEQSSGDYDELEARAKAYKLIADFIIKTNDKTFKRKLDAILSSMGLECEWLFDDEPLPTETLVAIAKLVAYINDR